MFKLKIILSLAILCFALHNGLGAPTRGRYMFVRCNPTSKDANCLTHRSPKMELTPDLPTRLPASAAEYIETEPMEEEPVSDYEDEQYKTTSPMFPEESSGGFEGSAFSPYLGDGGFVEPESGSGDKTEVDQGLHATGRPTPRRAQVGEAHPHAQEMREDHLLQL
ncbi:serglycin [Polymixia lowei]